MNATAKLSAAQKKMVATLAAGEYQIVCWWTGDINEVAEPYKFARGHHMYWTAKKATVHALLAMGVLKMDGQHVVLA
jgi:hypothetical protein